MLFFFVFVFLSLCLYSTIERLLTCAFNGTLGDPRYANVAVVFVGIVHPKGVALIVGAAITVHLELIARIVDLHVADLILRNANALDKLLHFS